MWIRRIARAVRPRMVEAVEMVGAGIIILTELLGLVLRGSFSANWLPLAHEQAIRSGGVLQLFFGRGADRGDHRADPGRVRPAGNGPRLVLGHGGGVGRGESGSSVIVVNYLAAGALFCIGLYTLLTVRALHNGSTNDYAAYGVIGVIVTLVTMALR